MINILLVVVPIIILLPSRHTVDPQTGKFWASTVLLVLQETIFQEALCSQEVVWSRNSAVVCRSCLFCVFHPTIPRPALSRPPTFRR